MLELAQLLYGDYYLASSSGGGGFCLYHDLWQELDGCSTTELLATLVKDLEEQHSYDPPSYDLYWDSTTIDFGGPHCYA